MNKDVLVIGGGVAGMQAALLLAEKDHKVHILDSAPAVGGFFPLLDRQFPTNSCGVCFMSPRPPAYCPMYESDFHRNIDLLTNCEVVSVKGRAGDFSVSYLQRPRYVDPDKCTLCGKCVEVCPVEAEKEFGTGIRKRKAIYTPIGTVVPRTYSIDDQVCTKCGECVKVCSPGAIALKEEAEEKSIGVGAIVLGFGFEPFEARQKGEYGLGRYKNVVSSIQYERMLSFASATEGLPGRLSDGKRPRKVAFIQCVGSRDPACGQPYCSSICCMYATKQAMISRGRDKNLDAAIFYMDIRPMGKDYERYYERAREQYGVRYVRSAISTIRELKRSGNLLIEYAGADGRKKAEEFDMVVLSLGFTPPEGVRETAEHLGVALDEYGFCLTEEFSPAETSVPGVFVAGAFREPRDIPESVVDACSAAAEVSALLDDYARRDTGRISEDDTELPEDEELRVGVFLADSKGLLADGLMVDRIVDDLKEDGNIKVVEKIDVASLNDAADAMKGKMAEQNLNRAVVAGYKGVALCRVLKERSEEFASGASQVEHANIGEQCANVHLNTQQATEKAARLIRAAVRKVCRTVPVRRGRKQVSPRVLVVGGGVAGLSAALSLAGQGMDVTLVEKSKDLGGNARYSYYTAKGSDIQALVKDIVTLAESEPHIEILKGAELKSLMGTWGSFRSIVTVGDEEKKIEHGAVIFATGGKEVLPEEYLFGKNPNVMTQRTFERKIAKGDEQAKNAKSVVMILCVGSRDEKRPYCSRICCNHAVKNSLKLKEINPDADILVLYRDMRTYGFYEKYYHAARDAGVIFVRYEASAKPQVVEKESGLSVSFVDPIIGEEVTVDADLLVLSTALEPSDNTHLADAAGVELNADGFFLEANAKASPLDSVDRGKYFCGLCHSPNHLEDVIAQGKAAAARASALLWKDVAEFAENLAYVQERLCSGCGLCVSACPYEARRIDEANNVAVVLEDLCKGCGTCVISCPNGASQQRNYERSTMMDVLGEVIV